MILGLGTDICENERIEHLYHKYEKKFLNRVYTKDELNYCLRKKNPIPHLTARFALKEAVIKSLRLKKNTGLSYKQIFLWGHIGRKDITVSGELEKLLNHKGVAKIWFSISHAGTYSTATVVLEK